MRDLREDFPLLSGRADVVYMDSAATSLKPAKVIEAMDEYYREYTENIHRGVSRLAQRATDSYEAAREKVASFIGARPDEVIFTSGTTASINMLAQALRWRDGDEVVVTRMEHHSNLLPWMRAAELRGLRLKLVDLGEDGRLDMRSLEEAMSGRTRAVAVAHASNVTGVLNDLKEISKVVHDAGALLAVDGAQSVPHVPVDVRSAGADFMAFSGHKMLGPTGIGALYVAEGARGELSPPWLGGGIVEEVREDGYRLLDFPYNMEPGTPNIAGAIGLGAAVDYLRSVGMEEVARHESELAELALRALGDVEGLRLLGPRSAEGRLGIFSFALRGLGVHEVAALLDELAGIVVRSGYHCAQPLHERYGFLGGTVRASLYLYNTREDVERLAEALGRISRIAARTRSNA